MSPDIVEMQREHEDRLRKTNRWIIAETQEGFEVHTFTEGSVAPWAVKETKEMAVARLIQMMGIKHAIVPQAYPERVQIGSVTTDDDA